MRFRDAAQTPVRAPAMPAPALVRARAAVAAARSGRPEELRRLLAAAGVDPRHGALLEDGVPASLHDLERLVSQLEEPPA